MRLGLLASVMVFLVTSGCDQQGRKASTQVAAQVNGDELTIHQVNNIVSRTPNVTPEVAPKVKREILERLINQQLAKQQAVDKKLDRTPAVVQAVESAKAEILARAYLEQVAASQPKPTPEEIKKYYADNPELFAQRRIFHIEEIIARANDDLLPALREQVARTRSLQGLAAWLKGRNAQFVQNERILGAEEVPLASLRALQKMKEGDIQVSQGPDRISIFRIVSARSAPVSEAAATPRIQQFLLRQRANQAMANEMKRLREIARIEYHGEFAADPSPAARAVPPSAPASPAVSVDAVPETPDFDKGLRGLK